MKIKYVNRVTPDEELEFRTEIPDDYHLKDFVIRNNLRFWEIYSVKNNKYYSNRASWFYKYDKYKYRSDKHLDEGHFQGFRFAVQQFTKPGEWVFDPTVGSGTAIIEAINNGRNALGIELEFCDIARKSIELQYIRRTAKGLGLLMCGNVLEKKRDIELLMKNYNINGFNLIVNGPPYPRFTRFSADSPAVPKNSDRIDNYKCSDNIGLIRYGKKYKSIIKDLYRLAFDFLLPGGFFVYIVKDPVRKRKYFPLQESIYEWIKEDLGNRIVLEGVFIHKHAPETYFIRTYRKRFPDVLIPLYQSAFVLKKIN